MCSLYFQKKLSFLGIYTRKLYAVHEEQRNMNMLLPQTKFVGK